MLRKSILLLSSFLLLIACSKVPISGRKQMNLIDESQLIQMSKQQYSQFLSEHTVLPPSDPRSQRVERVGKRIAAAVTKYLNNHNMSSRIAGFEWEFHTVQDSQVNAWCMPGGKVVVYTGILPLCPDDTSLAVVMGHEISHAIARHGNERMSESVLVQSAGNSLSALMADKPQMTQDLFMQSYGISATLGTLAFSRNQESEADKLGLVFMSMAGYDPRVAPKFWEKMSAQGGQAPPEFLSTHPSDATRIADIKAFLPKALEYYHPNS